MMYADHATPSIVPSNDDEIAHRLLDVSGLVPDERVDWDNFHLRLALRAELSLARLRQPHLFIIPRGGTTPTNRVPCRNRRPWWEPAARWSRVAVGAALAAGTALIAVIRTAPKELADASTVTATTGARDATDGTRAAFESVVVGRTYVETSRSSLMPSAADLLIPIGEDASP